MRLFHTVSTGSGPTLLFALSACRFLGPEERSCSNKKFPNYILTPRINMQQVADSLTAADAADELSSVHRYPPKVVRLDLADLPSIPASASAIAAAFDGRVDILVNNAGMSYRGEIDSTRLEVDERLFTVNYLGQVALTKALLPKLLEEKDDGCRSHVVAVSSVQGAERDTKGREADAAAEGMINEEMLFDCKERAPYASNKAG